MLKLGDIVEYKDNEYKITDFSYLNNDGNLVYDLCPLKGNTPVANVSEDDLKVVNRKDNPIVNVVDMTNYIATKIPRDFDIDFDDCDDGVLYLTNLKTNKSFRVKVEQTCVDF